MQTFKRLRKRLREMTTPAYLILKIGLLAAVLLLSAALLVLIHAGTFDARTYEIHYLARELYTLPAAILLIAVIASGCVEERSMR